jgi:hypothetical protein
MCSFENSGELCNIIGTMSILSYKNRCVCICKPGFNGERCDRTKDICEARVNFDQESECLNGGSCLYDFNSTNSVVCKCPDGFAGDRCQIEKNNCEKNQCKFGKCMNQGKKGYACVCSKGWEGENCDRPINYCSMSDCIAENTLEFLNSKFS